MIDLDLLESTARQIPARKLRPEGPRSRLGAQTKELKELGKDDVKSRAREVLDKNLESWPTPRNSFYADARYAVLFILQAMDAAGKDGIIKHVMRGVNPQGCQVFSFKEPSATELEHDFLWRLHEVLA